MPSKLLQVVIIALSVFTTKLSAQTISFSPPSTLSELQEADGGSMDIGDIDDDGDLDLIIMGIGSVMGGGIQTTLYLNNGSGFFTEMEQTVIETTSAGQVAFVDVDSDDDLDLVIIGAVSSFSSAIIYLNDGTGEFTAFSDNGLRPSRDGGFASGDVDDDGDIDLLITGRDFQFIDGMGQDINFTNLFLNDGEGNFSLSDSQPFEALISSSTEFIDLENDGDLDVILTGVNDNEEISTTLYSNDGTGSYTLLENTGIDNINGGGISVADSDNDGDQDILICGDLADDTGEVSNHYLNDGEGNFMLNASASLPGLQAASASKFADLDNDGDQDILLFGIADGIIGEVYENMGTNVYLEADTMFGSYISSLVVGDIDGDNDLDFLVTGSTFDPLYPTSRTTRVFFNDFNMPENISVEEAIQINVYPNPTTGVIQLDASQIINRISLLDLSGRIVHDEKSSGNSVKISLNSLSPGTYICQVYTAHGVKSLRIIRE